MKLKELRPASLDDFQGKPELKENLRVYLDAAIKRGMPIDHILFHGLAGTGKTSLAYIVAYELNKKIKIIQGPHLQRPTDIINILSMISEGDIVFIDEIHAVNISCIEMLYGIMEDFAIDIAIGKDFNTKLTRVKLPHFTLIGATTSLGKILEPLEERFGIIFHLGTYKEEEILDIIKRNNTILNVDLGNEELKIIAQNSKGIPRIANRILRRVGDYYEVDKKLEIQEIISKLGILTEGLVDMDYRYLLSLYDNQDSSIGIKSISQTINVDTITIEEKIEPYLLNKGYINKSTRGRNLTFKGESVINTINGMIKNRI